MNTKRTIALILLIAMLCTAPVLAADTTSAPTSEIDTLYSYIKAMTSHDWDTFLSLTVERDRADYRQLINDPASEENLIGLFNVTKMEVLTAVGFNLSDENTYNFLMHNSPLSSCVGAYDELRVILFCVDVKVQKNVRPNFSGYDGRVAVLAKEDGEWRVAMFSCASKALMEKAFPEEKRDRNFMRHMERLTLRYKTGLWVGDDGKIFDSTYYYEGMEPLQSMELAEYTSGQFSDVSESAWYGAEQQGAVKRAFRMKIMAGMGNGTFAPQGELTVAQAIKMACVVRSISSGGDGAFTQGTPWYQVYVDYAKEHSIIDESFTDYNKPATRAEVAYIFAHALSTEAYPEINACDSLPDVKEGDIYTESIFVLYRAGILTGYEDGSFHPNESITRAEAAAVVTRLTDITERVFVYQTA